MTPDTDIMEKQTVWLQSPHNDRVCTLNTARPLRGETRIFCVFLSPEAEHSLANVGAEQSVTCPEKWLR